jgi:undecaprenyl-diphosphatase
MTILQSIILGIVQGITEFLPISSSGHLVLVPYLFGWKITPEAAFVFDVLVQVATLVAVFAYFWDDLLKIIKAFFLGLYKQKPFANPDARLGWLIILATIPAGVAGLLLKDTLEQAINSPLATACFLFGTAGLLVAAERLGKREHKADELSWLDALIIGLFQIMALFPGISRSGSTITGGMLRRLDRPAAARFSFLISIPIMMAAGLLAVIDLFDIPNLGEILPTFVTGFIAAAVTGYLSIRWLLKYLSHRSLYGFAIYCTAFGLLSLIVILVRG